jgi:hypothetical protein
MPGGPAADSPPDPGRQLVIEGNKAWAAAGEVHRPAVTITDPSQVVAHDGQPYSCLTLDHCQRPSCQCPLTAEHVGAPGRAPLAHRACGSMMMAWCGRDRPKDERLSAPSRCTTESPEGMSLIHSTTGRS